MTLARAIIYKNKEDVENLISRGADVSQIDEYGYTPLIESVIVSKPDITKLLLDAGAPVDQRDTTERTALHWAVDRRNAKICKLLLENGAPTNAYSMAAQPILTYPLLRNDLAIKKMLYEHGASLDFAQDFINAKLLGHRFELASYVHIVEPSGDFIIVNLEGFFFEFTSNIIQQSLQRYKRNFDAKHLYEYFMQLDHVINAFSVASKLLQYANFLTDVKEHENEINELLKTELLIIPIAYQGHAITAIKYKNLFVKCDRGEYGRKHGSVLVYKINKPRSLTKKFLKTLLYGRITEEDVQIGINETLGLEHIFTIPLPPQVSGNCSWANMEAAIPVILFLMQLQKNGDNSKADILHFTDLSIDLYNQWSEWDKDRAVDECIQSFERANDARKATKAHILAVIFAHRCDYTNPRDLRRAEKIYPILDMPGYRYVLDSYIREYTRDPKNPVGRNLQNILDFVDSTR